MMRGTFKRFGLALVAVLMTAALPAKLALAATFSKDADPKAKPAAKADDKPEAKPETKSESNGETKPDVKSEAKPAAKGEAKPEEKPPATAPAEPQAGPDGHIVKKGNISRIIGTDGVFVPADGYELKLTFKQYNGPLLINRIAPQNVAVKKGDVLLEIDPTVINWHLAGVENELKAAKANLAKAESDVDVGNKLDELALKSAEDFVKNAESAVRWFENVDGPQMQQIADLQAKQAEDIANDQNDELEQLRKMYKDEELTTDTADIVLKRAIRSLDRAKVTSKMMADRRDKTKSFDYAMNRQRVVDSAAGAKHSLDGAKAAAAQAKVSRETALVGARLQVEQLTKRLNELKEDAENFSFKAPFAGSVAYGLLHEGMWLGGDPKTLKPGEKVALNQVILRVFTPGQLRVNLIVPEAQAFWVENAMKAKVTPAVMTQTSYMASASTVELVPRGNPPSMGFQVALDPGEVDRRLVPGMKAHVYLDCGGAEDVVIVPVAAVAANTVKVRGKNGDVTERNVVTGKSDGQNVEIRKGLKEGEEVILPGKK